MNERFRENVTSVTFREGINKLWQPSEAEIQTAVATFSALKGRYLHILQSNGQIIFKNQRRKLMMEDGIIPATSNISSLSIQSFAENILEEAMKNLSKNITRKKDGFSAKRLSDLARFAHMFDFAGGMVTVVDNVPMAQLISTSDDPELGIEQYIQHIDTEDTGLDTPLAERMEALLQEKARITYAVNMFKKDPSGKAYVDGLLAKIIEQPQEQTRPLIPEFFVEGARTARDLYHVAYDLAEKLPPVQQPPI